MSSPPSDIYEDSFISLLSSNDMDKIDIWQVKVLSTKIEEPDYTRTKQNEHLGFIGKTFMHIVCENHGKEGDFHNLITILRILIDIGCDPSIKDSTGLDCFDYCKKYNRPKALEYLRKNL